MSEPDDCEYCLSSKRIRRNSRFNVEENNNNYTPHSEIRRVYECVPTEMQMLLDTPELSYKQQWQRGWNPLDASINIDVKQMEPLTLHRHPVAQSTDGIRSKTGYKEGVHLWRINWKADERGTHAVVGICTINANLHCHGYCSLIGIDADGWGWDIVRGRLVHDGKDVGIYGEDECTNAEEILVLLDMDAGTLSFSVSSRFLGVAFRGLKNSKSLLYPAVSAVWGHCEVSMTHLATMENRPISLLQLCRFTIRKYLKSQIIGHTQSNTSHCCSSASSHRNSLSQTISISTGRSCWLTDESFSRKITNKINTLDISDYLKQYLSSGSFRYS